MKLRRAEICDTEHILEIIKDAQLSLRELEIPQWQDGYPNEAVIQSDIAAGKAFVLESVGNLFATAAISTNDEPTYENLIGGKWQNDAYAVVHRVAVANSAKQKGIGALFFQAIEQYVQALGVNAIRIDTHELNLPMLRLLAKLGYEEKGIIFLKNGDARVAFEKNIEKTIR